MHLGQQQALRGGGTEGKWTCDACLMNVKLLDPLGRIVFGVVTALSLGIVPYMAVSDRAREADRLWLVAGTAVLAVTLVVLFVRDLKQQRLHPWADDPQAPDP